jgi:hypothetical protein
MALRDSTIHLVYEVESGDGQYSGQYESLEYVQIRVPEPALSIQDGSSDGLGFTPDVSPGTTNNAVGIFSLSAGQTGAAFDSVAVTNTDPGIEGISTARLFWSDDQTLDVNSDIELDEVAIDASGAPDTIPFSGFSPSIPTTAHYAILAIDVEDGASAEVQFELAQVGDLSVPGGTVDTVNGQHQPTFSALPLSEGTATLPVELSRLNARVESPNTISLRWQTASETNNAVFHVQRRTLETGVPANDGETWNTVGSVEGGGTTSTATSYQFTDRDLPYETDSLAYRLKQVDVGGGASYSETITIERAPVKQAQLLGVSPNPTQDRATVRFAVSEEGADGAMLRLYDVMGRRVRTVKAGARAGRNSTQLDTSRLSSGAYFLRLQAGGTVETQRLTVVR